MTAAISALCAVAVLAAIPWVLTRDTAGAPGHRPPRRRAVCPTCRKHHNLDGCEGRPPAPGRWWA